MGVPTADASPVLHPIAATHRLANVAETHPALTIAGHPTCSPYRAARAVEPATVDVALVAVRDEVRAAP